MLVLPSSEPIRSRDSPDARSAVIPRQQGSQKDRHPGSARHSIDTFVSEEIQPSTHSDPPRSVRRECVMSPRRRAALSARRSACSASFTGATSVRPRSPSKCVSPLQSNRQRVSRITLALGARKIGSRTQSRSSDMTRELIGATCDTASPR